MRHNVQSVPYGYEPPEEMFKGTFIFYDTFETVTERELDRVMTLLEQYQFDQVVFYPLHEETFRRMTREPIAPYYKREQKLHDWKRERDSVPVMIEGLEGKRKKYTPFDTALRHLTEKFKGPYFIGVTPEMANRLASYSSFEEWIVKLRLLLTGSPKELHPRLEKFKHRWNVLGERPASTEHKE